MTPRPSLRRAFRSEAPSCDILVVCTANICRSPFISALLSAALPDLTTASAGTAALVGQPVDPVVVTELERRGLPATGAGRQLTRTQIAGARLVVAAAGQHRAEVTALVPAAFDRTFTAKELARALGTRGVGPDRPADPDDVADFAHRTLAGERWDHDDDIVDPYLGDAAAYATMFAEAEQAVTVLVGALRSDGA